MGEGFDGCFVHSQPVGCSLGREAEAVLLFAAGHLRLEGLSFGIGAPQEGVTGSTGFILSHEHGVVVVRAFIENNDHFDEFADCAFCFPDFLADAIVQV